MKAPLPKLALLASVLAAVTAMADTHYVSVNSTNPVPPYTNWATAANVIQDAVDAAATNDMVLVANGVYDAGGKAVFRTMTNRVAVERAITLRSVMGPDATIIKGYQVPVTTNGDGAIRCVYLTNGAVLIGFTLTNGGTRTSGDAVREQCGGGLWCGSDKAWASNCVIVGNSAKYGGGSYGGTLHDCTLLGNYANDNGGGATDGTLNNCTLLGNSAEYGGGSSFSTLNVCTLSENSAHNGGASENDTLNNCTLSGNSANNYGGGSFGGTLNNCMLLENSANSTGGGSYFSTLNNCTLSGNSAGVAGGARSGTLNNCTVSGNSAIYTGGGSHSATLNNCIVYYNTAGLSGDNYFSGPLNYCCTTPLPIGAAGNITNAPLFIDTNGWVDLRLQSNSPCINSGNNAYAAGTNDLDSSSRIVGGTVDMGAYEFHSPASTISYAWLQSYGLPTDGSADNSDWDGDHATAWQEWKMWTNPTNEQSVLRMLSAEPVANGASIRWQAVGGHDYTIERAMNDAMSFEVLHGNIVGQDGTNTFIDTGATNADAFFYRVSVPE